MAWYKTGTISITASQTSVIGINTKFASNAKVGDGLRAPDGEWYEIVNIASETTIGIFPAYLGATVSDSSNWMVAPLQGYNKETADRLRSITDSIPALLDAKQNKNNRLQSISDATPTSNGVLIYSGTDTIGQRSLTTTDSDNTAGRITKVGDYGLGYKDNTPFAGSSLNPNNYRTGQQSVWGQFILGGDLGTRNGWLSIYSGDASNICQQFIDNLAGWTVQRVQSAGVWSDWSHVFAQSNNKNVFNANNLPIGSDWSVNGVDAQASSNNWPVVSTGSASVAVWWNITTRGVPNRVTQIAIEAFNGNNGVMYTRSNHDGTWSAWKKVMLPGDYGIGGQRAAFSGNIDSLRSSNEFTNEVGVGFYRLGAATGTFPEGAASANGGVLRVHVWDTSIATQWITLTTGTEYIRYLVSGNYTSWERVYTSRNVTTDAQTTGILSSASIGGWRLTKYRNGMFICSRSHASFSMPANVSTRSNFTLPITAAYTPECSVIVTAIPEATDDWYGVTAKAVDTTTTGYFRVRNGATPQQLQQINVTVIGFWN